jgi:putative ABC transport system permease protein
MGQLLRRLEYLVRRGRHDAELGEEIDTHQSLRQAQLERDGLRSADARRTSRRAFGNDALAREDAHALWTFGAIERGWQDLNAGARILRTAPGLTLASIALVALVIGGNATIYSMVHGVLTKGTPGVAPDGLVTLSWLNAGGEVGAESSYDRYRELAARTRSLAPLLGSHYRRVVLGTEQGTYATRAGLVSPNYFEALRVRLERGREPSIAESGSAAAGLVAVISHRIWLEQFGGADDVVGRRLTVNGRDATVIGVAPRHFHGAWLGEFFDVWLPFSSYSEVVRQEGAVTDDGSAPVLIVGRLAVGVSRAQAQAEVAAIDARLEAAERSQPRRVVLLPYSATAGGNSLLATQGGRFLAVFSIVTILTMLIVCANVANLMLGRALSRQREMAVRRSLGCSHLRLVRMLVAEGLVVAALAWAVALAFAWVVAGVLARVIPPPQGASPGFAEWFFRPDWNVAAYAMALAALATVACVVGPVIFAWRQPLTPWLKAGEHSVIRGRSRLSRALVVLQLALSVLLVAVAGLAWRSLSLMDARDLGFRPDHILLVTVNTTGHGGDRQATTRLLEDMRDRLRGVPGALTVSYVQGRGPREYRGRQPVRVDSTSEPIQAEVNRVGPDFLAVHGLGLAAGQGFGLARESGGPAVLINQHLAETLWPGSPALGRHVEIGDSQTRRAEVVGVVPDAFFSGFRPDPRPSFVFFSTADDPPSGAEMTFYVRYDGPVDRISAGIRDALGRAGADVPVVTLRTMEAQLAEITALQRILTSLLAAFGIGALVIATLGQYSVVLFEMRRRIREFGVRLALGATPQRILSTVMREGARLSVVGLVIGGALSLVVGRLIGGPLYGISATDGTTYLSVAVLFALTTVVACAIPARLASRVDPLRVLRDE